MKQLKHFQIPIITLMLLFNSCDACKNSSKLPTQSLISEFEFELLAKVEDDILYLDEQENGKLLLTIQPKNEAALKSYYQIVNWTLPPDLKGQLLDVSLQPITRNTQLIPGQNILYYKPLNIGQHTLTLEIADQHNELKKEVITAPIDVKGRKQVPFNLQIQTASTSLFLHQQATIFLDLTSVSEEAANLSYIIKDIQITQGDLFFEDTNEKLVPNSKVLFGNQKLIFKPMAGAVGQSTIKITVSNSKGDVSRGSLILDVKPILFNILTELRDPLDQENGLISDYFAVLDTRITDIDTELLNDTWQLISWKNSDGTTKNLTNSQFEQLNTPIPLKITENNRLYIKLNKS